MDNNCNNHLAPVIYVAESPEQAINYKWDSRTNGLDKNVVVLEPNEIKELGDGKKHFDLPYDLTPGEILVRHPYNQGYIKATDAEDEYLPASAEGIFQIARCLGATKIIYKKCNIAEFKREIDSDNHLKYKVVDISLNVKNTLEQKLLNKISMTREFPKQEFTIDKFNKAKLVAEERGLLMSRDIRSLIDARDPELGAPMSRQTINVEISSSLNKAMDIAFTLNTVPFFNLNSNTKIATEKKYELNIEWDITF
jgi:hypothetical protein